MSTLSVDQKCVLIWICLLSVNCWQWEWRIAHHVALWRLWPRNICDSTGMSQKIHSQALVGFSLQWQACVVAACKQKRYQKLNLEREDWTGKDRNNCRNSKSPYEFLRQHLFLGRRILLKQTYHFNPKIYTEEYVAYWWHNSTRMWQWNQCVAKGTSTEAKSNRTQWEDQSVSWPERIYNLVQLHGHYKITSLGCILCQCNMPRGWFQMQVAPDFIEQVRVYKFWQVWWSQWHHVWNCWSKSPSFQRCKGSAHHPCIHTPPSK